MMTFKEFGENLKKLNEAYEQLKKKYQKPEIGKTIEVAGMKWLVLQERSELDICQVLGMIASFQQQLPESHRREQKLRQINSATMTGMKNSMNITIMPRKRMSWQRNFAR